MTAAAIIADWNTWATARAADLGSPVDAHTLLVATLAILALHSAEHPLDVAAASPHLVAAVSKAHRLGLTICRGCTAHWLSPEGAELLSTLRAPALG